MKYGFIGCGNMGGAVARAVCKGAGSGDVLLANRTPAKAQALADELGCACGTNEEVAGICDFIGQRLSHHPYDAQHPRGAGRRHDPVLL